MNNNRDTVVGIGEVLWDVFPKGRKLGGAPANFAYHVAQFGLRSMVVSAICNDELGREIENIFKEKNLDSIMPDVAFPTGIVQVTLDCKGVPSYDIKQGVAWDNIPYSDKLDDLAARTSAVCFGSLAQRNEKSRKTILAFLDKLPEDVWKIFDINLRQNYYSKNLIEESLNRCNVLKINDDELVTLAEMFDIDKTSVENQCRKLLNEYNLRMVILTCGEQGSYVINDRICNYIPTPKVVVSDTVGAGDSFTGAFVAALLKGKTIKEAHELAVKVSAYVCQYDGAMPDYSEELKKLIL